MRTIYASSLANFSELSRRPSNDRTADRDKVLAQINALVAGLLPDDQREELNRNQKASIGY
jgi:hypothetical protein